MATNQEKYRTEYIIDKMGFGNIFDGIFSSAYLGYTKDNPQFFIKVVKDLNLLPQEILLWDNGSINIEVARKTGLHAEYYTTFADFKQKIIPYLSR